MEKALESLITKLDFDPSAPQLEALKASLNNTPEKNAEKVQRIREKMSNGDYEVKSKFIAEKLLLTPDEILEKDFA